jgi:phosphoribosylformylglycinamidine (FGAM) synthase-like enzyme
MASAEAPAISRDIAAGRRRDGGAEVSVAAAPAITPQLVATRPEAGRVRRILDLIGREPTVTELGIFSAMWNEHCSYKSSKRWLRTLPTTGPW